MINTLRERDKQWATGPMEDKTLPAAGFLSHADPKMGGYRGSTGAKG